MNRHKSEVQATKSQFRKIAMNSNGLLKHSPCKPIYLKAGESPAPASSMERPKLKISGQGLVEGFVNQQNMFFIQIPRTSDVLPVISLTFDGPSHAWLEYHHVQLPSFHFLYVSYRISEAGEYLLNVNPSGHLVTGSPFKIQIRGVEDLAKALKVKVKGEALQKLREGEHTNFKISTKYSGDGTLTVSITGPCSVDMSSTAVGIYCSKISFTPPKPGYYFISIKFNGFHIRGSPFRSECICVCDKLPDDAPELPKDDGIRGRPWVFV